MTVKEARKLIAVLMVMYPNYKPVDTELAASVWADSMEEYTYRQTDTALRAFIKTDTSGFAPTPGQLIEKIHFITHPQELNEMEAWALVSKAIRNSGYNSAKEFAKLPEPVQKAVGAPEHLRIWAMDEDYNEAVISSNFLRCYRNEAARQKEISKIPEKIRELIQIGCYGDMDKFEEILGN